MSSIHQVLVGDAAAFDAEANFQTGGLFIEDSRRKRYAFQFVFRLRLAFIQVVGIRLVGRRVVKQDSQRIAGGDGEFVPILDLDGPSGHAAGLMGEAGAWSWRRY